MLIAVCDDDKNWCDFALKAIEGYMKKIGRKVEMLCFQNSEELLNYEGEHIDAVFMDIELGDQENGISAAKKLNDRHPRCQIIYLTNYLSYAMDVYQTEHTYFVLKEQMKDRLPEVFEKVTHRLEQVCGKVFFTASWGREIVVQLSDMYYLERELRYTIVHTAWGDFQVKEKLDSLMDKLPKVDFSRCHYSYIIYFPAVREKRKNSYILVNGKEVMISRGYLKQTNEDWTKWALFQMS